MTFETIRDFAAVSFAAPHLYKPELVEAARCALRAARKLPVGDERNELRQIALAFKWLSKRKRDPLPTRTSQQSPTDVASGLPL